MNISQDLFLFVLVGIIGAVATFLLQKQGLSAVVASCIVGLAGALVGHFLDASHIPLVVFAGSFVGMTSTSFGTIPLMIVGGLLTGVIYNYSLKIFEGFGGRLGTIAFISTVVAFYLLAIVKKYVFNSAIKNTN